MTQKRSRTRWKSRCGESLRCENTRVSSEPAASPRRLKACWRVAWCEARPNAVVLFAVQGLSRKVLGGLSIWSRTRSARRSTNSDVRRKRRQGNAPKQTERLTVNPRRGFLSKSCKGALMLWLRGRTRSAKQKAMCCA